MRFILFWICYKLYKGMEGIRERMRVREKRVCLEG